MFVSVIDQSRSHATLLRGLDLLGRVLRLLEPLFDLTDGRDGDAFENSEGEAALDAAEDGENAFPKENEVEQVEIL